MNSLLLEERELYEQLSINENAKSYLRRHSKRLEAIATKTVGLLESTHCEKKKRSLVNTAFGFIDEELDDVYNTDSVFESAFGKYLISEIRTCADLVKERIINAGYAPVHVPEPVMAIVPYQPTEVVENVEISEVEAGGDGEEVDVVETMEYDLVGLEGDFWKYVEKHHATKLHSIIKKGGGVDTIPERVLKGWLKGYVNVNDEDGLAKVERYAHMLNEENGQDILKEMYFTTYGNKHKKATDASVFQSAHFRQWLNKNVIPYDESMEGGRTLVQNRKLPNKRRTELGSKFGIKHPPKPVRAVPVPMPMETETDVIGTNVANVNPLQPSKPHAFSPLTFGHLLSQDVERAFFDTRVFDDILGFMSMLTRAVEHGSPEMVERVLENFCVGGALAPSMSGGGDSAMHPMLYGGDGLAHPMTMYGGDGATNQILEKVFSDLAHDFKLNSENNVFQVDNTKSFLNHPSFATFVSAPKDENRFFKDAILSMGNPLRLMAAKKHGANEDGVDDITVIRQGLNDTRMKLVVEDMGITKSLKAGGYPPISDSGLVFSTNTYANLLDPITPTDERYRTSKTKELAYNPDHLDHVVSTLSSVATEFFLAIFPTQFVSFRVGALHEMPGEPHYFPCVLTFSNTTPIEFRFLVGMFTVFNVNLLIANKMYGKDTSDYDSSQTYAQIVQLYDNLTRSGALPPTDAIVFLQCCKSLGDHAQVHEYKRLFKPTTIGGDVNVSKYGDDRVVFGTKDRILIAEAIRMECPVLFQAKSLRDKFPDMFRLQNEGIDIGTNKDDVVFYYTGNLQVSDDISVLESLRRFRAYRPELQVDEALYDQVNMMTGPQAYKTWKMYAGVMKNGDEHFQNEVMANMLTEFIERNVGVVGGWLLNYWTTARAVIREEAHAETYELAKNTLHAMEFVLAVRSTVFGHVRGDEFVAAFRKRVEAVNDAIREPKFKKVMDAITTDVVRSIAFGARKKKVEEIATKIEKKVFAVVDQHLSEFKTNRLNGESMIAYSRPLRAIVDSYQGSANPIIAKYIQSGQIDLYVTTLLIESFAVDGNLRALQEQIQSVDVSIQRIKTEFTDSIATLRMSV